MKKVLAIMLACFMLVSLLPMGALAEEIEQVKCPYEGKNHYKTNCEYTWVADVKGECGEYDYTVYSCNACGDYFAADFVKIDSKHAFVETKAATCTEAGEKVCSICEAKKEIPALGHKASGEASCLEASVCERCGVELDPKTAHAWGEKPSAILKEPNEETLEDGLAEYTCTVCGEKKEVIILAHQCAEFTFKTEQAPSCMTPGMKMHFQCNDEKCLRYWTAAIVGGQIIRGEIVDKAELEIPAIGEHGEPEEMVVEFAIEGDGYYTPGELPAGLVGVIEFTYESYSEYNNIRIQHYIADEDLWETIDWVYADGEVYPVEFVEGEQYRVMWMNKGTLKFGFTGMEQIIPGSCTEDGLRIWQCSVCHEKVEENLGKQHNWAVTYHTEPTCTTFGYTIESCLDCGEHSIVRHDALGHTERPENCNGHGNCKEYTYYWWCERCGEEQEETVEATCPTETVVVEANCSSYGYTYTYCTRGDWCSYYNYETNPLVDSITGKLPNGEEVTIKLPEALMITSFEITADKDPSKHNEADKAKGNVVEPTCEEEGLIAYWCTDCETPVREPIAKLGHDYNEELVIVEPTCGENGYIGEICNRCGKLHIIEVVKFTTDYIYMDYESAASCHNLEGAVCEIFREGICGELAQLDRYLCATCNEYILVKNDSFENHVMPEDLVSREEAVQPEDIVVEVVFTGKGDKFFTHEFPADVTVTFEAMDVRTALYFDGPYIEHLEVGEPYTMEISAGEHEINLYKWDGEFTVKMTYTYKSEMEFAGVEATCTEDGYTAQYYCERCGKFIASEEIKAAGHKEVVDVEAKEATCTEAGCTKGWHCEVCDYAEESKTIPALGHTVVLVDSAEWEENKQYGYEHYQCTTCGYEYIINYEPVCIHEWNTRADRDLSIAATCTKDGLKVYKCLHCDAVKEEIVPRLHHTNAAGQDLEYCGTETEDCICASCKEEFEIPAHEFDDGVYYPANCLSNAYIMYTCQVCDHYEVEDITDTKGDHVWGRWAPVYDENGVVVEEARGCAACGKVERREVTEIAYSAIIENAANAEGTITDGSLVKVTIAVSGSEDNAWGFQLNIPYTENMTFVEAKFVTTSFTYAAIATNHDGFVTIIANADGDVTLNGKENIVELYFTVSAPEISEIAVEIENVNTLNAKGETVDAVAFGANAETVLLMELDGFEGITLADALAAYNLIVGNEYDAAADLDKDGTVTLADYLYMFNFLSGAMDYEDIVALG